MELDSKDSSGNAVPQGEEVEHAGKREIEGETALGQEKPKATADDPIADRLLKIHAILEELTSSPWSHDVLELAIATVISPLISEQDASALVWLLIVGPPSGDKTVIVLLLKGSSIVLYVDTLTENALASGYAPEHGRKREPDLLEQIEKDGIRCLLIKDLTTLFSLRDDRVKKVLGELQSVFDGEFVKATGTVGLRKRRTNFSIIACVTPHALIRHHRYMSLIGGRFLSYAAPRLTDDERKEGFEVTWETTDRRKKMDELRQLVAEHVKALLEPPVELEPETLEQRARLNRLAELLAHGRAALRWRETRLGGWEIESVQTEEPYRALQQFRNLGRALTLVHGRTALSDHELEIIRQVVLSSIPADRAEVVARFQNHPEGLTAKACAEGIGKSEDRARQLLNELERIGMVVRQAGQPDGQGRPPEVYLPVAKFTDLIVRRREPVGHMLDLGSDLTDKTPPKDKEVEKEAEEPPAATDVNDQ